MRLRLLIVPVIDLRGGEVVQASGGDRARYQPLSAPLCRSSSPAEVIVAMRRRFAFSTLYIADLDAIQRRGDNCIAIASIAAQHPQLTLWVDAGIRRVRDLRVFDNGFQDAVPVVGTETALCPEHVAGHLNGAPYHGRWVLSLDFGAAGLLGSPDWFKQLQWWPQHTLVMSLARVGTLAGPDFERLRALRALAPGKNLYAAGGVRNDGDIEALKGAGLSGALVGSAIYQLRLNTPQTAT